MRLKVPAAQKTSPTAKTDGYHQKVQQVQVAKESPVCKSMPTMPMASPSSVAKKALGADCQPARDRAQRQQHERKNSPAPPNCKAKRTSSGAMRHQRQRGEGAGKERPDRGRGQRRAARPFFAI